jgi:hypothetical protein
VPYDAVPGQSRAYLVNEYLGAPNLVLLETTDIEQCLLDAIRVIAIAPIQIPGVLEG